MLLLMLLFLSFLLLELLLINYVQNITLQTMQVKENSMPCNHNNLDILCVLFCSFDEYTCMVSNM